MIHTRSVFSLKPSACPNINRITAFILMVIMSTFMSNTPVWSQTLRDPVYAGSFYPADPAELRRFIQDLTVRAGQTPIDLPAQKKLKALIMPHAGYVYSGFTAAHVSRVLKDRSFSKVILMSPDHRVGFRHIAVSDVDAYKTPLGIVRLHESAGTLHERSDLFQSEPLSDQHEHAVEVVLPFLQVYLKEFTFIPMVIGQVDDRKCFEAIDPLADENTLLVVSSDLSHYLPYEQAVAVDKDTIDNILSANIKVISEKEHCACGRIPILVLLHMAKKYGWQPVLLQYANSGDTAGTKDKVVGYAAIAFFGDQDMKDNSDSTHFTEEQGQALVRLARQTISKKLGKEPPASESANSMDKLLESEPFQQRRGAFVTLKKKGQLRGCIGSLAAYEPIADGVRDNAINAAFRDPRFRPLSAEELDDLQVEVSILTEPKPLAYTDAQDLVKKLRVHVDGVILRKGGASATFLPQVWDQLPDPEQFLSHLCQKAGLPGDAWKTSKPEISTYQVEYFEEP
jgi:MEMO1 family protein